MFNKPVMSASIVAALQLHHERQAALAESDARVATVLTDEIDRVLAGLDVPETVEP